MSCSRDELTTAEFRYFEDLRYQQCESQVSFGKGKKEGCLSRACLHPTDFNKGGTHRSDGEQAARVEVRENMFNEVYMAPLPEEVHCDRWCWDALRVCFP